MSQQHNKNAFDRYQEAAARTANHNHQYELANYGLGVSGEAGEVADLIKKVTFHEHVLDKEELTKELGDVIWYIANIARLNGILLSEVATKNIEKLKKRYPEGFDVDRSINRNE